MDGLAIRTAPCRLIQIEGNGLPPAAAAIRISAPSVRAALGRALLGTLPSCHPALHRRVIRGGNLNA